MLETSLLRPRTLFISNINFFILIIETIRIVWRCWLKMFMLSKFRKWMLKAYNKFSGYALIQSEMNCGTNDLLLVVYPLLSNRLFVIIKNYIFIEKISISVFSWRWDSLWISVWHHVVFIISCFTQNFITYHFVKISSIKEEMSYSKLCHLIRTIVLKNKFWNSFRMISINLFE